jgi:hypothetical protein
MKTINTYPFKHKAYFFCICMLSFTLLFSACKKEEDDDDNNTPTPDAITDTDFYKKIGSGIIQALIEIFNDNIAGQPSGSFDINASGPRGGTVHIFGSGLTDTGSGITTTDFDFDLLDYVYVQNLLGWNTDITLTGPITFNGTFSDTEENMSHQSLYFRIDGRVTKGTASRVIKMTGDVSISRSSPTICIIFGHEVEW